MKFSFDVENNVTTVRGNLSEVQARVEAVDKDLGMMTIGAAAAMASNGLQSVSFPLEDNPAVDNAPFEIVVHNNEETGAPTCLEFRFLKEVPAHG